jgi:hypothetical protein
VAEGHHIHHWARGGKTKLSNLALLCRRHHRAVHEEGFQLERDAERALIFRRPNGWTIPEVPEPPEVPVDPMQVLRDVNIAQGLDLDGDTMTPSWGGERLDVPYAIDVLHPRALASRPDGPKTDPDSNLAPPPA